MNIGNLWIPDRKHSTIAPYVAHAKSEPESSSIGDSTNQLKKVEIYKSFCEEDAWGPHTSDITHALVTND